MLSRGVRTEVLFRPFLRAYSSVVHEENSVKVFFTPVPTRIERAQVEVEDKARLIQNLEDSFYKETLNEADRRIVFRPSVNSKLSPREMHSKSGNRLEPRRYPGLPSKRNLYALIDSSETIDELINTAGKFALKYARFANTRPNLEDGHLIAFIRKASKLGDIKAGIRWVRCGITAYPNVFSVQVSAEILRWSSLRLRWMQNSKLAAMNSAYKRCTNGETGDVIPGAKLVRLFGYVQFTKSRETKVTYEEPLKEVLALSELGEAELVQLDKADVALGLDALKILKQEETAIFRILSGLDAKTPEAEDAEPIYETIRPASESSSGAS